MERSRLEESLAAFEAKLNTNDVMPTEPAQQQSEPTRDELIQQRLMGLEESLKRRDEEELNRTRRQVEYSLEKNPDQMAQVYEMSERSGIPLPVVEQNFDEIKNKEYVSKINKETNPAMARFYSDPRNAQLAHDDIEVFAELERHLGALASGVVSLPQMVTGGTAAGIEAGGRLLTTMLPDAWVKSLTQFERETGISELEPAKVFRTAEAGGKLVSEFFAPEEQTYTTQLAAGLGQAAAQIGAMVLAPQAAFPSLFAQNISQQEQRREGVNAKTITSDLGLLASGGLAIVERFGLEKLINRVPAEIQNKIIKKLTDISVGAGYEAATEVIENVGHGLVDYLTNNPDAEIFKGVGEDAAVGAGVGAIIRAILPSYKGTSKVNQQVEETKLLNKTQSEQQGIDQTIALLQKSKSAKRGADIIQKFTDQIPDVKEYRVSTKAFEGFEGEIPSFVKDQTDAVSGEFTMTNAQLASVVNDTELLNAIRPHMRISDDTLTPKEMEEGGPTTVKNIMEQAAESAKMNAEAEKMTKKVIDKLVATGRISKNNARYGAAVIEAYVTTKASNLGLSVKEVFKIMNFDVKRVEDMDFDFGNAMIETDVRVKETGQKVKVREKKQIVYDQKLKQRDIVNKLRDCVNG